ncbi:AGAP007301-PA-like protein [Anopheles sinensis]|uniref:AGAP007301-PA-like protein n=1 Tax=Anopheles sinensis TaxID=74873 RepID=A0A084VQQ0_ANOSI|nr:AGAP007301-PA-like protein [Anopheles sinensis]
MMHYKKGKNVEEDLSREHIPIEVLPEKFLWMQVKGGTAVQNVVEYAKKALEDGSYRSVVWSGSDGGVGKTVSCAEILKRHFELHQVTRICYRKVEEFWDPQQDGLERIVAKRNIPCVHILLSMDEIDTKVAGYQHSKVQGGFWLGAGIPTTPEGARKRNYFSGPQLNKRANRSYGNGTSDGAETPGNNSKGGGKSRGGGTAGGSQGKGKQQQGAKSKSLRKGFC